MPLNLEWLARQLESLFGDNISWLEFLGIQLMTNPNINDLLDQAQALVSTASVAELIEVVAALVELQMVLGDFDGAVSSARYWQVFSPEMSLQIMEKLKQRVPEIVQRIEQL